MENENFAATVNTEIGVSERKIELPLKTIVDDGTAEPSVDLLNSNFAVEAPKSSIGVRKIQPKKSGLGSKKVLGATKVKTNFADIEERANMANQIREPVVEKKLTAEEEEESISSVRLAYQDLSMKKQKEEDRLKNIDPNKAKQMERLGMAFNIKGGVSHSMMSDMKTIDQGQTPVITKSSKNYDRDINSSSSTKNDSIFDDYSTFTSSSSSSSKQDFRDAMMMGFEPIENTTQVYSMFAAKDQSSKNSERSVDRQPTSSSYGSSSRNRDSKSSPSTNNNYDKESIEKKFGSAKGISSDQFFGNDQSQEKSSNLSKFQGSTSISSADYFDDGQLSSRSKLFFLFLRYFLNIFFYLLEGGSRLEFHSPDMDMDDVKDSIRTGVTKVAGKLSSLANNVNNFIQDKYGH